MKKILRCPAAGRVHVLSFLIQTLLLQCLICIFFPIRSEAVTFSCALQPDDVAVVINSRNADSKTLALYYMRKRYIPWGNLITLDTVLSEGCSRHEYDTQIAQPLKHALQHMRKAKRKIRCLVLMYGMPLKIRESHEETAKSGGRLHYTRASVDSELTLALAGRYPLEGWIPNPLFSGFKASAAPIIRSEDILMVSRLDGPDPAIVRRIIDDADKAEEKGLRGVAYFDARWKAPGDIKELSGYRLYDAAIHHAESLVKKSMRMRVVAEDTSRLFHSGECSHAALYCGWYSLAQYVDAFQWVQGAVGYHIASAECTTLKKKNSRVWCKKMLEKGIAATIGPVYEPYVQAFPLPDIFFSTLIYSGSTLAEAYYFSLPYISWQMVLVGDPLYRPFKAITHYWGAKISQ